MPRCGCSGSSCSCSVKGGEGIEVTGNGSADLPYVIDATGSVDLSEVITFVDTTTVDFTVTGAGTSTDPWTVQADAAISMSEITDFTCASPTAGDMVMWDGSGWVCSPVSAAPGAIVVDQGLTGDGSAGDPLEVKAIDWPYPGHTDDSDQDDGVPVYFASDGSLLVPRGVYGWQVDSGGEWDPERAMGDNSDTVYRNPVTVALGAHDDPVYRYFNVARRDSTVATRHGESELYHTFSDGMSMLAFKVVSTSEKAAGDAEQDSAGWFYMRRDGQVYIRSDALTRGTGVTRPLAFAQQHGSVRTEGAANTVRSVVVTFASGRFTDTPAVQLTATSGTSDASSTNTEIWATAASRTSVTVNVNRTNATPVYVNWSATQEESVATLRAGVLGSEPDPVGLPGHPAPMIGGVLRAGTPMVSATCETAGCPNNGVAIAVPATHVEDGITYDPSYLCGVCGQPITDLS